MNNLTAGRYHDQTEQAAQHKRDNEHFVQNLLHRSDPEAQQIIEYAECLCEMENRRFHALSASGKMVYVNRAIICISRLDKE